MRHNLDPSRYLLSRSLAPELVSARDILEFDLDSNAVAAKGRNLYTERFIHGEIYRVRPDVTAIVHSHAPPVVPFGATHVPLRPMSGSREFRLGLTRDILPALDAFRPELLLVSAGFDAHKSDPLAQLMLEEADYVWVTEQLLEMARQHAGGRIVSTLEGGYDLPALGASAAAHVRTLMSAA